MRVHVNARHQTARDAVTGAEMEDGGRGSSASVGVLTHRPLRCAYARETMHLHAHYDCHHRHTMIGMEIELQLERDGSVNSIRITEADDEDSDAQNAE
jgi:hypothetical protein